jgi:hypothetical protein
MFTELAPDHAERRLPASVAQMKEMVCASGIFRTSRLALV